MIMPNTAWGNARANEEFSGKILKEIKSQWQEEK